MRHGAERPAGPRLVGRHRELQLIDGILGQVATDGGGAVVISGDSGVGKTALAREALGRAADRGFVALEGGANPLHGDVAYGPLVQALDRGLRSLDPPDRSRLVADLPALGTLFVGLGLPRPEPLGSPALERTRLFQAVVRLVDRMSRRAPLAILMDDLQWFDRDSVALLAYLTRDLPGLPVLLIGTFATQERDHVRTGQLEHLLQAVRHVRGSAEIELEPLQGDDVRRLCEELLGGSVSDDLADLLASHTAGIPLFARALVDTLRSEQTIRRQDGEWTVPRAVQLPTPPVAQAVIGDRLARCTEDERRLVQLMAVGGGALSWDILGRVIEEGGEEASLVRLIGTGLVTEHVEPTLTYELAHPLIAQVAYGDLAPPRRRRLHARFAQVLSATSSGDVGSLAVHARRALPDIEVARAIEWSVAAGRRALDAYANSEARGHLDAALALLGRAPGRTEILLLCGEARLRLGEIGSAVSAWQEALDAVGHDHARAATIHLMIARALGEVYSEQSEDHVRAGLAAARNADVRDIDVDLLYRSVVNAHRRGEVDRIQEAARQVASAAERVNSDRARALAAAALLTAKVDESDFDGAERMLNAERSVLTRAGGEARMLALLFEGSIATVRGDLPALRRANRDVMDAARRSGLPTAGGRAQLGLFVEAFYSGDWERAQEIATEARLMAEALDHRLTSLLAALLSVILHAYRGEFDEANALIASRGMRRITSDVPAPYAGHIVTGVAIAALEQGEPEAALGALQRVDPPWTSRVLPPWWRVARAEALARLGRSEEARAATSWLTGLGREGTYPAAMAHRIEGLLHLTADEPLRAVNHLGQAGATFRRLGMPFEEARAGIEQAEAALRLGRAGDLGASVEGWLEITAGLGANGYAERARRILHALGRVAPAGPAHTGLTPRQLEIARLVTEGMSNAEIAEALFVSPRTVESHLDHIYTRLGISSRVALATYVTRGDSIGRT